MQQLQLEINGLLNVVYTKLAANEDPLKQHRAQLKTVISEFLYLYREQFESIQTQKQTQSAQGIQAFMVWFQSRQTQPTKVENDQSVLIMQNYKFIEGLQDVYENIKQPHLLLFTEDNQLQNAEAYQVLYQQCQIYLNLFKLQNDQLQQTYSKLIQLMIQLKYIKEQCQNYVTKYSTLLGIIQGLLDYYEPYLHQVIKVCESIISNEITLQQAKSSLNPPIKSPIEVKCPFRPISSIPEEQAQLLINNNKELLMHFREAGVGIVRIRPDDVFNYQRQFISYAIKRILFNLDVPPAIVIRFKFVDPTKRYCYFFITQYFNVKQPILEINHDKFASHFLASLCTDHLDQVMLEYYGDMKCCYNLDIYQENKGKSKYEQLRNPLYWYKDAIVNHEYRQNNLKIEQDKFYELFLQLLDYLRQTQSTDFSYPAYSQAHQDYYLKRKRSLQLNLETLQYTFQNIIHLHHIILSIKEVILPQQNYFTLVQITKQINPLIFYFFKLDTSVYTEYSQYVQFLTDYNLEEILPKIVDQKYLLRYNKKQQECSESIIDKKSIECFKDYNEHSQLKLLSNKSLFKYFPQSPNRKILHFLQSMDLVYDATLTIRIMTLDYLAANMFFIGNHLQLFAEQAFQSQVVDFHKSWKKQEIWQQAFRSNYSVFIVSQFKQQFLVELIGILFGIDVFQILKDKLFDSLKYVEEQKQLIVCICSYIQNVRIKGDYGHDRHITIVESALKHQKFKILLELLLIKEGNHIDLNYFNYLLNQDIDLELVQNTHKITNFEYHPQIFAQINTLHPSISRRLIWNHAWTESFKCQGCLEFTVLNRGKRYLSELQLKSLNSIQTNEQELTNVPVYLQLQTYQMLRFNSSKVRTILPIQDKNIHQLLMLQPNFPGQKVMATLLYQLLNLDSYCTQVEIGYIDKECYSFYEVLQNGISITEFLQSKDMDDNSLVDIIGSTNISNKILLSILLLPSRQSPDEEVLINQLNHKIPITTNTYYDPKYDAFINTFGFQRKSTELQLMCKNVYFLTDFMNELVDPKTLNNFKNSILVIQQWLKQLSQDQISNVSQGQTSLYPLEKDLIINLTRRAHIISMAKPGQTYLQLLKQCDRMLGEFYEFQLHKQELSLLEKYQLLNTQSQTEIEDLLKCQMSIFNESFRYHKQPQIFDFNVQFAIGPTKCQKILQKYDRLLNNSAIPLFDENLHIISKPKHQQLCFKHINWFKVDESQSIQMIERIKKFSTNFANPFDQLYLDDLNIKLFSQYFFQLQLNRIKFLSLNGVQTLCENDLMEISQRCHLLHHLIISHCANLTNIYDKNKGTGKPLIFQQLKTLIADNMDNLKEINISGPNITNMSFNDCPYLLYINDIQTPRIQKIRVQRTPQLKEEIIQLWIIRGIKVLFSHKTSNGHFGHYLLKEQQIICLTETKRNSNFNMLTFETLRNVYQQLKTSDTICPISMQLIKTGFLNEDIYNKVSLIQKRLDEDGKLQIIMSFFKCLIQNDQLVTINCQIFGKKQELQKQMLTQFLEDFLLFFNNQKIIQDASIIGKVITFFSKIDRIVFSWPQPSILILTARLINCLDRYLPQKQQIYLDFSNVRGIPEQSIKEFFKELKQEQLKKIFFHYIDLSCNTITKENCLELLEIFQNPMQTIQFLDLKNTGLNDKILEQSFSNLWTYKCLKSIDFSDNLITNQGLDLLLKQGAENNNSNIHTINLSNNNVGTADFYLINEMQQTCFLNKSQSLVNNPSSLQHLILQQSFLNNINIEGFCNYILITTQLESLDLRHNQFSEGQLVLLSSALCQNTSLLTLSISNKDEKISSEQLLQGLASNRVILSLNLEIHNEVDIESTISQVIQISNVQQLELTINTLSVDQLEQIRQSLVANSTFKSFDLKIQDKIITNQQQIQVLLTKIEYMFNTRMQKQIRPSLVAFEAKNFYRQDTYRLDAQDYCRIGLSIDGGGMRGIIPASIINYACTKLKRQAHEIFDCIGGTSIGGIMALGLTGTADGINPLVDKDTIVDLFKLKGKLIFDNSSRTLMQKVFNKSLYDPAGINSLLDSYFGVSKLSDVMPGTNVIVTAVALEKTKDKNMAKVFSSRLAKLYPHKNFLLKDVGRSTSAAPIYFPAAEIQSLTGKKYKFIDGGVGKNNPSNLVLEELKKGIYNQSENNNNLFLLSLSTGIPKSCKGMQVETGMADLLRVMNAFGTSNEDFVDKELMENYRGKYLRVVTEFDVEESKAMLDITDSDIILKYEQAALETAERLLEHEQKWGRFNDRSFLQWLEENTARKLESRI